MTEMITGLPDTARKCRQLADYHEERLAGKATKERTDVTKSVELLRSVAVVLEQKEADEDSDKAAEAWSNLLNA